MRQKRSIYSKFKRLSVLAYVVIFIMACNTEVSNQLEPKGTALGKMNEIVVIADKDLWEGAIGDTFRYYFESAYPIMPQPEPLFDLRHFTPEELAEQPLRKELRTYSILADLSNPESSTTKMVKRDIGLEKVENTLQTKKNLSSVGKDKWARGQLLIYLYGADRASLNEAITQSFSAMTRRIHKHDEKQLRSSIYVDKINQGLSKKITERYSLDFTVPGDFVEVPHNIDQQVLWLRKDTDKAILNIVFQRVPYKDQKQLSKEGIITLRNSFGKTYVSPEDPNNVMIVDDGNLPVYEYTFDLQDHYGKELRGIWEMTNTFSGGPFNTYLILDEARKDLIYIDVFVLAPGTTKRNLMMQLDYLVKNAKLI